MKRDWIWPPQCSLCSGAPQAEAERATWRLKRYGDASMARWQCLAPLLCWRCILRFESWWRPREQERLDRALPDRDRFYAESDILPETPWMIEWLKVNEAAWEESINGPHYLPSELDLAEWLAWVMTARPMWSRNQRAAA